MALIINGERVIQKYSDVSGEKPTVPSSNDHSDGTWCPKKDIYVGELWVNTKDKVVYTRDTDNNIIVLSKGGKSWGEPFEVDLGSSGETSILNSDFKGVPVKDIQIINHAGLDLRSIMEKDSGDDSQVNFSKVIHGKIIITIFK